MKHVTFTKDMRPRRAGDRRVLPDELAAKLEAEGAVERGAPDWPEKPVPPMVEQPATARKPKTYRTK